MSDERGDDRPGAGRVARLSHPETVAAAEAAGTPTYLADLSIFQVLFRNAGLADALNSFLAQLLFHGALDPRLRELIIMRVGWRTGSVYEWAQHWRIAPQFGAPEADVLAVREHPDGEQLDEAARAVLDATDEILDSGRLSDEGWAACSAHLGTEALLELPMVVGAWDMVSKVLQTLEVPLEDGVAPWPPDGRPPDA